MAEHPLCQQERRLADINSDVNTVKSDVTEVKVAFRDMLSEFRGLTKDLRDSLLDGRELKVEVQTLKRDLNQAFDDLRSISTRHETESARIWAEFEVLRREEIKELVTFKETTEARFSVVKIVPVLCTIIVALLTIYDITNSMQEKENNRQNNYTVPYGEKLG